MDATPRPARKHARGKSPFALPVLAGVTLLAVLVALRGLGLAAVPAAAVLAVRWLTTALFVVHAVHRRSLTTWIVVSMVIGAQVGYDLPSVAVGLRLFSLIFLRMIKTIIAPLLFSTLVVGIAGHSDLKQVGRMGVKSLVYFEAVTTLALFIGLAAINISQAGEGHQPAGRGQGRGHGCGEATGLRHRPPHLPREHRQGRGRGADPPGRRLRHRLRHRPGPHLRGQAAADPDRDREPGRADVQVHQHRHALRPGRRRLRHRLHGRAHGARGPRQPGQAPGHASTSPSSSSSSSSSCPSPCSSGRRSGSSSPPWSTR